MKLFLTVLSVLAVFGYPGATAKTTLVDFGGSANSFSTPWNLSSGQTVSVLDQSRKTAALKDSTGAASGVTVTFRTGTALTVSNPSNVSPLTSLTANQAFGTYGLAFWKAAHGTDLTTSQIQNGWVESSLLGIGQLVGPGSLNVGGFQKSSAYTVSAVFTVSGLANVASFKTSPVTLQGSNFSLSHAFLTGRNGQVVDVLNIGNVELASLLSGGTFMMTWQFQTNSAFNTSSTINMDFSSSLLTLGGNYGISAMAVTDGTPVLPPSPSVPEPSSALLSVFGLAGLVLRRRRK